MSLRERSWLTGEQGLLFQEGHDDWGNGQERDRKKGSGDGHFFEGLFGRQLRGAHHFALLVDHVDAFLQLVDSHEHHVQSGSGHDCRQRHETLNQVLDAGFQIVHPTQEQIQANRDRDGGCDSASISLKESRHLGGLEPKEKNLILSVSISRHSEASEQQTHLGGISVGVVDASIVTLVEPLPEDGLNQRWIWHKQTGEHWSVERHVARHS